MTRITINGVSLDPVMQSVALMAAAPEVADATRSNYVLVQTRAPLSDDEKDQLADLGVVIHEYVPDDTYLCGFQPTDLAPIRALPFVTWAGVYLRGFKINPSLRTAPADPSASIVPTGMAHGPSRKPRTVDVVLHDDADSTSTAVLEQLSAATRLDPTALHAGRRKVRLTVEEGQLDRIAALDQVHHIEEIPQRQLFNDRSRQIIHANTVVNSTTYQGAGEVIAVADTGFDRGSTANVHPAFTGRVARLYPLGRPNPVWSDPPRGRAPE
ncbi:hypothetical protein [Rhodococcus sp. NPDC004095]